MVEMLKTSTFLSAPFPGSMFFMPCSLQYCRGFRWEWMGSLVFFFFWGGGVGEKHRCDRDDSLILDWPTCTTVQPWTMRPGWQAAVARLKGPGEAEWVVSWGLGEKEAWPLWVVVKRMSLIKQIGWVETQQGSRLFSLWKVELLADSCFCMLQLWPPACFCVCIQVTRFDPLPKHLLELLGSCYTPSYLHTHTYTVFIYLQYIYIIFFYSYHIMVI